MGILACVSIIQEAFNKQMKEHSLVYNFRRVCSDKEKSMGKKVLAGILALMMAVSLNTAAFAADTIPSALMLSATSVGLKTGETVTLIATIDGAFAEGVSWTSSDPSVAAVSGGLVTAATLGRTTITAKTADGRTATCVVHVALKGIDVSQYQGAVDWLAVKAGGVDFAILRTGYGNELPEIQTDNTFSPNYAAASANGIKLGAYHVSYATTPEVAVQEAQMCLSILQGRHLDYPVFIDIEHSSQSSLTKEQITAVASAFCSAIVNAGYKAGVYSTTTFFNGNLSGSSLDAYDKWVAHPEASTPNYSGEYTMWQYSHAGSVPGINGLVDLNYSYRDYPNPASASQDTALISDTGSTLNLQQGKSYVFRFKPNGIKDKPTFTSGNSSMVKADVLYTQNGYYYFKIIGTGKGVTSVYSTLPGQKAVRRCLVTVK